MSKSEKQVKADPISSVRPLARREWLTTFAVGGIAAATAALPKYASSQTRRRAAGSPELELRSIKAALEPLRTTNYVEEGKRQGIFDEDIDDGLSADINQFLGTTYQALVYSQLVNELPDDVRNSEEVQSDIAEMSPVLDQALADAHFVVGMADDGLKTDIDRELRENPDLLMDMAASLDEEGARHGMGIHGRLRLRRASAHISARLRMQSTNEVAADVTDKLTRIAERNHVEPGDGRHVEVSLAAMRMMDFDDVPTVSIAPAPTVEPSTPTSPQSREAKRLERKAKRLRRASGGLAGTGAGLLIAGGVGVGVTGAIGWAGAITLGALAILLALFILGAAVRRRKQAKEALSQSTTDP
ncbi:MAG: hypothetical protein WBM46_09340 [Polyangiales bacterium]|jgi:hypothetical protein